MTGVNAAATNTPLNTIFNDYNGNITDANVASNAAIAFSKIAGGSSTALGAWQSWTPTWVNFTVGNGTNTGNYIEIGKTVFFRIVTVLGSTSSMSTGPTFSLPVTSITVPNTVLPIGWGAISNGSGTFNALANWATTTTGLLRYWDTNNNGGGVTSTTPGTWATNYAIVLQGQYEAA